MTDLREQIAREVRRALLDDPAHEPFRYRIELRSKLAFEAADVIMALILPLMSSAQEERRDRWRPIETAPQDGTDVLVYRADAGVFTASFTESTMGECRWFAASGEDLTEDMPTHWMPRPSGPEF